MEEQIPLSQSTSQVPEAKRKTGKIGRFFRTIAFIFVLIIGGAIGIFVTQQKPELFGLNKGAAAAQAEVDATVAKVGKLIDLPTDEKPNVATVSDASKVKDQQFFRNAQNGDIVLIYTKAQKAILYDPKENKIVEVEPVSINNNQTIQSPIPLDSPSENTKETPTPSAKSSPKP